jgi:hypothetical protein
MVANDIAGIRHRQFLVCKCCIARSVSLASHILPFVVSSASPHTSPEPDRAPSVRRNALFLIFVLLLVFTLAMTKRLDHDEHQFVASAALLARQGLLPYRDYPYFHVPYLVYVYAAAFRCSDHLLLWARIISAVCGFGVLCAIFFAARNRMRVQGEAAAFWIAVFATGALIGNPVFIFTTGRAWNHDVPTLLALLAFFAVVRGVVRDRIGHTVIAGLLMGLATGTRLTFLLPAIALAAGPALGSGLRIRRRVFHLGGYLLGAVAALAPLGVIALKAPLPFYFDNLSYPTLNTAFRLASGYSKSMLPAQKMLFILRDVLVQPGTFPLVAIVIMLWFLRRRVLRQRGSRTGLQNDLLILLFLSSLVAGCAPTPLFTPYFFAPIVFLVLWCVYAVAEVWEDPALIRGLKPVAIAGLSLIGVLAIPYYARVVNIWEVGKWVPMRVHRTGIEIAHALPPHSRVMSVSPLFAMEGGARIFPSFATGPFALRVAPEVPEAIELKCRMLDLDDLKQVFWSDPTAVVVTGADTEGDARILDAIGTARLDQHRCDSGFTVWTREPQTVAADR